MWAFASREYLMGNRNRNIRVLFDTMLMDEHKKQTIYDRMLQRVCLEPIFE